MLVVWCVAGAAALGAQTGTRPEVVNGIVDERAVTGGLAAAMAAVGRDSDPAWVAYAVPAAPGGPRLCDWNTGDGTVHLEPGAMVIVMARMASGQVERVRAVSETCRIDAGGRRVHWLNGVRPADSATWLASLVTPTAARPIAGGALAALAWQAEPAALDTLIEMARTHASTRVRGEALFWLAQRAGARAVGVITDAVERDPDTDVKRRAVFALSQLPADEGVPRLIEVARRHSNKAVQKQAFFWLGQSRDARALAFLTEILRPR